MAKASIGNSLRNILSGVLVGLFMGTMIWQWSAYDGWIKGGAKLADPANGMIHAHNEHGSIVYLTGAQSVGVNLMFLMVPMFFLAILISPKKNVKTGFASARWDQDDPYWLGQIAVFVAGIATFAAAHYWGMEILGWIAQSGIGVTNDQL